MGMMQRLPNILTFSRIAAIPLIIVLLLLPHGWAAWSALVVFALAGFTDWLDGYIARRYGSESAIGKLLDPIADKLLVAAVLLVLVHTQHISGWAVLPAVVILLREVAVSGLREFLAGIAVSVPVSQLAKWKTAMQMIALGFLIVGDYAGFIPAELIGDIGLWVAGALTLVTGWDYWQAGVKHLR